MKFLFHIAYLVCVSSLPISQLPEGHLPPMQSLVGLRSWSKSAHLVAKGTGRSDAKCTEKIIITEDTAFWPEDPHACDTQLVSDDTEHGILCCTNDLSDTPDGKFMKSRVEPWTPGCWAAAHFGDDDKNQCPSYVIYQKANPNSKPPKDATYFAPKTSGECAKHIQEGCMIGTWSQANAKCSDMGARLCTEDELSTGCADQTGCWFDQRLVWTSPKTTLGYTIELRRPTTYKGGDKHHLHIREIKVFDNDDNECKVYFRGADGGASALMNPGRNWEGVQLTPERCIDGNIHTMNHNDFGPGVAYGSEEHFMQFECFCESIGTIKIYNRNDGVDMAERLSSSVLTLMRRSDGATIDSHTIGKDETDAACCGETATINWCPTSS